MSYASKLLTEKEITRLWGKGHGLRVFLSHRAEVKDQTAAIKEYLKQYSISSFVAHEDIEPTKEWQIEIEAALRTMHVLVVLITGKFHSSPWTNQEIGYALGLGVPIIPIRIATTDVPQGFIGKIQAATCLSWEESHHEILKRLAKDKQHIFPDL